MSSHIIQSINAKRNKVYKVYIPLIKMGIIKKLVWPIAISAILLSGKVAAGQEVYDKSNSPAPIIQEQQTGQKSLESITKKEELISLELKDTKIEDALSLLFKSTGYSFVLEPGITGNVSASFKDVNFSQTLNAILGTNNLTYRKEENIYYINKKQDNQMRYIQADTASSVTKQNIYFIGKGGRYELQFLDSRTVSAWFGGSEAQMGIVPWPAESGGAGGGNNSANRTAGRTGQN